jgi:acyl-coenzyme A thioesterase PaaI-like protein
MNRLWARLSGTAPGRWLFARLICWKAPYFSTIRPRFEILERGRCELSIAKRRAVLNHIGTVHAIAMCNMAELAAGCATEATLPATHRWIPKGMSVDYLLKAESSLRAIATVELPAGLGAALEVAVPVRVLDTADQLVFQATVRMWVSPKRGSTPSA